MSERQSVQCKTDLSPEAGGEVLEIKLEHDANSDMIVYGYLMTHPLTLLRLVTEFTAGFFHEQQQLTLRKSDVNLADAQAVARQNMEKKERALVDAGNEARSLATEVKHLQTGTCHLPVDGLFRHICVKAIVSTEIDRLRDELRKTVEHNHEVTQQLQKMRQHYSRVTGQTPTPQVHQPHSHTAAYTAGQAQGPGMYKFAYAYRFTSAYTERTHSKVSAQLTRESRYHLYTRIMSLCLCRCHHTAEDTTGNEYTPIQPARIWNSREIF